MKTLTKRERALLNHIKSHFESIKVPKSCHGKIKGEYWKIGAKTVIQAYNDAVITYGMPKDFGKITTPAN